VELKEELLSLDLVWKGKKTHLVEIIVLNVLNSSYFVENEGNKRTHNIDFYSNVANPFIFWQLFEVDRNKETDHFQEQCFAINLHFDLLSINLQFHFSK
jgi:hypothetical protein